MALAKTCNGLAVTALTGALTGALMGAMTAASAADPIIYDNSDGAFRWLPLPIALFDPLFPNEQLDVTQPSSQQTEVEAFDYTIPHGVKYLHQTWENGDNVLITLNHKLIHGPNVRITFDRLMDIPDLFPEQIAIPRGYAPGELVGPGDNFSSGAMDVYFKSEVSQIVPELLTLGEHGYVGLELTLDTGIHYGWIELEAHRDSGDFVRMRAIRWAWESTPGARILVPSTGAGVPLLGLVLAARRRRRGGG